MFANIRLVGMVMVVGLSVSLHAEGLPGQTTSLRQRIVQHHFRFVPPGPGPFPTLVAVPGCSGIAFPDAVREANHPDLHEDDLLFRAHYPRTAQALRDKGFAVLLIHVHAAEGLVTACNGEIPADRIASYIDEALNWASGLDFVDPSRLHLIGWSMGGRGVLAWLHGDRHESESVRSAIAVYPACSNQEPLTNRIPLLMLLGGADDIADPSDCEVLVAKSSTRPLISRHTYPGARHGYDIIDAPPVLEIGSGLTIGYQQAAAEATWREILGFLRQGR